MDSTITHKGALAGVRVLDFTRVLAGPFCTMLLADLGADVIKVEDPAGGDDTRQWGPPWAGEGSDRQSAYYLSVNRNKRSLTLNLKTDVGRDIAQKLAAQSHIVVENFKPGQIDTFGLGYETLAALNPVLVFCSITGFGQTGLYKDRPGYDFVVQGMSGLMSITGPVDGEPYKVGVAISDVFAGLFAIVSILAALRHAERTGQGQRIDIALLDSQIAALVNVASNYLVSGDAPRRYGNEHANIVPYQAFRALDGEFTVAVGNDRQFARLCALLERPDLADDRRFATNPARVQHRQTLIPILQAVFEQRPVAYWVEALLASGIPSGEINTVAAALDNPHVESRGLVGAMTLPSGDLFRYVASPLKLSATPPEVRLPPPLLGQHTDDILREMLGVGTALLDEYHQMGVV